MIVTPVPLAIPVEKTEEGYDYPPVIDYHPGLPGRKNATPCASTAELFREYTHFNLRVGSILLPKTCAIIGQENILVERPIADCGSSNVLLVKVLNTENSERSRHRELVTEAPTPCVARLVKEPTRQFWREVGVWSSLRHENIVQFIGVCISDQGPLSICQEFPEGSLYDDNARLRASANSTAPIAWGLRSGWTLVSWVRQLASAMAYLHGLQPWPVLYRNLKSSNLMLSENHQKVSLTDFAICRPLAANDDITPAQGSDRWLAPEALMGEQFDLACDVFSFSLVCYEIIACEIPYAIHSSRQAATLIVEGLRPTVPAHCPDWLTKLMAACNAHLPDARPSFAAIHHAFAGPAATEARGLSLAMEGILNASERVMVERIETARAAAGGGINRKATPEETRQSPRPKTSPASMSRDATRHQPSASSPAAAALQAMMPVMQNVTAFSPPPALPTAFPRSLAATPPMAMAMPIAAAQPLVHQAHPAFAATSCSMNTGMMPLS